MFPGMHEQLSAVGLPAPSAEAMEQRAIELAPFGEYETREDGGSRIIWRDASGAGLSILSDADHVLQCIIPFFASPPRVRGYVRAVIEDPDTKFADRVVTDVADLHDKTVFRSALLVHDLASSRRLLSFEDAMDLGLTLFVEQYTLTGTNTPLSVTGRTDEPGLPDPRIDFIARVLSVDTRINRASGAPFLHLKLDVCGLPIDAVSRIDTLKTDDHDLARGRVIQGTAMVVGALEPARHDTTIPRLPGSR
jgi:hypothetical protein